jgi:hypothetical protein
MPTLPNVGDYGGCGGVSIDLKDIVADSVTTTDLTVTGTTTLGTVDITDLEADQITVNGLGTVTINNRNMAAEVTGTTTHQVSWPPNRANYSGDGNPATNPVMGNFTVNGRQVHHGQILLERWPEGGAFDFLGPCLQITNPYAPVVTDTGGNVTQPAMTCFQFGHDFTNQLACSLFCFQYYGAGDSRNRLIIDSNANLNSNNPALVITMTQQGIPSKVGIHTSVPEAPLDVTGNMIIRDYSTKRRLFESKSEGATEAVIHFRDTSRSTNYSMADFDMYNGTITFNNPVDATQFFYLDNVTKKAAFSSDATTPFFEVDAINSTVKIYPALTTVPFAEFNCTNNTFSLYNPNGLQFAKFDSDNQVVTYNRTSGGGAAFAIFDAADAKCSIGARATEGLNYKGANTTLTGTVASVYGSLRVISVDTSNYCDLYVGMSATQELFRTQTSTNQVMIGTLTPVTGAILTVNGNVSVSGTISSSNFKVDYKGSTALTGSISMGTEPTENDFFKTIWGSNTSSQTFDGITYTLSAANSVPATTGFRGFRTTQPDQWLSGSNYNSSGTYTGSQNTTISSTARLGDRLDGTIKVGTTNQGIRIGSITLTFVVTSGAMVKNYIVYGIETGGTYIQLYSGANTVFTADTLVTITKESTGSLVTNWNSRYTGFGVVCLDVGGTLATTNIAAVRLFSVNGVVETAFKAEHYIPNSLEVGTDLTSPQVMNTNTFRVNGDSALNGPTVIRGYLNVFGSASSITPTLMTNSTLGRVGIGTSAPNSTLDVRGAITGTTTLAISNSGSSAILNLAAFLGTGNSITDQKTSIAIGTAYNSRNCARLAFAPNLTNTDNTRFAIDFGDTTIGEVWAVNAIGTVSIKNGLNVGGKIVNSWLSDLGDRVEVLEGTTVPAAISSAVSTAAAFTTAAVAAAEAAQAVVDTAQQGEISANSAGVATNSSNLATYIAENVPLFADLTTVINNVSTLNNMLQGYRFIPDTVTTVIENATEIGTAIVPFMAATSIKPMTALTNPQFTVHGDTQLNGSVDITSNLTVSGTTSYPNGLIVGTSNSNATVAIYGKQTLTKWGQSANQEVASFYAPDNLITGNSTYISLGVSSSYRAGVRMKFVPDTTTSGNSALVLNFNDTDAFKVSAWGNTECSGLFKASSCIFDGNTLVVDKTSRRVGMGTLYPSAKLDVVGDTLVSGYISTGTLKVSAMTSATTTSMLYYDTTSKLVTYGAVPGGGAPTDNPVFTGNMTVDTDTLFVDGTNNRIGIGTVAPTVKLDVVGDTKVSGNISTATLNVSAMTSATTTSMLYYDTTSKLVTYGAVPGGGAPTDNPVFTGNMTVDTDTLFVDGTNNRVGIKTTTPATDFDVRGTMSLTGTAQLDYTTAQSMNMYGRYLIVSPSKTGSLTSDCSINVRARSADNGSTYQNILGVDTAGAYSYIRSHGYGQNATGSYPIRIQPGTGSTPTWTDSIVCTTTTTTINNLTLPRPPTMATNATYTSLAATQIGTQIKWTPVSVACNNGVETTVATLSLGVGIWNVVASGTTYGASASSFTVTQVYSKLTDSLGNQYSQTKNYGGYTVNNTAGTTHLTTATIVAPVAMTLQWKVTINHNASAGGVVCGSVAAENYFYATRIG